MRTMVCQGTVVCQRTLVPQETISDVSENNMSGDSGMSENIWYLKEQYQV